MDEVRVRFAFAPGLMLEIRGPRVVAEHFLSEYGGQSVPDGEASGVVVEFRVGSGARAERYKSVCWHIELGRPTERPVSARVEIGGRPLSFVLSLLQGYLVEPLLAVAGVRAGCVLLPSAAIETERGVVLLLGRSRTGKSSLCARALAVGCRILGDDHVLLHSDRTCRAFPRRLRVYPDLERTAPAAFEGLPRSKRNALRLRRAVRMLTRNYVAPPLRLQVEELGPPLPREPLPLTRLLAIERTTEASALERHPIRVKDMVRLAEAVATEQRTRISGGGHADLWREALAASAQAERTKLCACFDGLPGEVVRLPPAWNAARCIDSLAEVIGLEGRKDRPRGP